MLAFKVTTVGASAGVILTKEAMARLKIQKGDTIYLTEAPDGGYRLTPYNPDFTARWLVPSRSCTTTAICCARLPSDGLAPDRGRCSLCRSRPAACRVWRPGRSARPERRRIGSRPAAEPGSLWRPGCSGIGRWPTATLRAAQHRPGTHRIRQSHLQAPQIGVPVRTSVRRIKFAMASGCPHQR